MGVTVIKYFLNQSALEVDLINQERNRRYLGIAPGDSRSMDDPIPWAFNEGDFNNDHYIEVRLRRPGQEDTVFSIWQQNISGDGDFVRFTQRTEVAGFEEPGPHVNGASEVDGNRVLRLLGDNSLLLERSG